MLNHKLAFVEIDAVKKKVQKKQSKVNMSKTIKNTQNLLNVKLDTSGKVVEIKKTGYVGKNQKIVLDFFNSGKKQSIYSDFPVSKRGGLNAAIKMLGLEDIVGVYQKDGVIYLKREDM